MAIDSRSDRRGLCRRDVLEVPVLILEETAIPTTVAMHRKEIGIREEIEMEDPIVRWIVTADRTVITFMDTIAAMEAIEIRETDINVGFLPLLGGVPI